MTPQQHTLFDTGHNARLPDTLTVDQLAHLLGTTTVWVQQLAKQGALLKNDHGSYPLETIPHYIAWLRKRASGRGAGEGEQSVLDVRAEKERYERDIAQHKARLLELEADEKGKSLVAVAEVEESLVKVLSTIKAKLRALPNGLAARVRVAPTDTAAHALLTTSINTALVELSKLGVDEHDPHPHPLPQGEAANNNDTSPPLSGRMLCDPPPPPPKPPRRAKGSTAKSPTKPSPTPPANSEPMG